jgi:hypothetical protein
MKLGINHQKKLGSNSRFSYPPFLRSPPPPGGLGGGGGGGGGRGGGAMGNWTPLKLAPQREWQLWIGQFSLLAEDQPPGGMPAQLFRFWVKMPTSGGAVSGANGPRKILDTLVLGWVNFWSGWV